MRPRGQERVEGFELANHGAFVSVAAQGGTLDVGAGEFNLSTLEGAEELCAAIAEARDEAPDESPLDGTAESDEEAATTGPEPAKQRGNGNGNGNGNGPAAQEGGPGNSGNAPGRNR